jgi:hypothetical protein
LRLLPCSGGALFALTLPTSDAKAVEHE